MTESEHVSGNVKSRCTEQGIDYYRLSPNVKEIVGTGETDRDKLIDMIIGARRCGTIRGEMERLGKAFPLYCKANKKMSKRLKRQ